MLRRAAKLPNLYIGIMIIDISIRNLHDFSLHRQKKPPGRAALWKFLQKKNVFVICINYK